MSAEQPWDDEEAVAFAASLQRLIEGAAARGLAVLQVFHVEETGHFSLASGKVRTLAPLTIRPDAVFHKHRHSALVESGRRFNSQAPSETQRLASR